MNLQERELYRKKVLGLTFTENNRENGVISIEVNSDPIDEEPIFNEPLESPSDSILKDIFTGFGIASRL